jgi:hypothetical protein
MPHPQANRPDPDVVVVPNQAPAGQVAVTLAALPPELTARYASPKPLRTPRPQRESPPAEEK